MCAYPVVVTACLVLSGGTLTGSPTPAALLDKHREAADSPSAVAPATGTAPSSLGPRVLHFPADRPLGKVMIRPRRSGRTADTFDGSIYDPEWEFIGPARGDVTIPAGHEVSLWVWHPEGWRDLTPLPRLRKLALSGRFTDKALEHLQKLPNLESLCFASGASFSPAALNQFRRNMPRLVHYNSLPQPLPQVRPVVPPRTQRR